MNRAKHSQNAPVCWKKSTNLVVCLAVISLVAGQTVGDELCSRTDGSAVRDQATGSILMAGAVAVGVTVGRDGTTFSTAPMPCPSSDGIDHFPDCDGDGLITLADFQCLYRCLGGPNVAVSEDCLPFDTDESGTVDLDDMRNLQNRFGTSEGM